MKFLISSEILMAKKGRPQLEMPELGEFSDYCFRKHIKYVKVV